MKNLIIKLALLVSIFSGLLFMPVLAASTINCSNPQGLSAKEQIQCGTCDAAGTTASCTPADAPKTVGDTVAAVVNVLSLAAGAVAVIMIIVGGFRYITSAGNPETAKTARNTITYAIIGLIIVSVAQIIVHFVLNKF